MSEEVDVDPAIVKTFVGEGAWDSFTEYLSNKFKIRRTTEGVPIRLWANERTIDCLCDVFNTLCRLQEDSKKPVLIEILRSFRNSMSKQSAQDYISENEEFMVNLEELMKKCIADTGDDKTLLKVLLQFLVNFTVSNEENGTVIYNTFFDNILKCIFTNKCLYEASALLYNMYLNTKIVEVEFKVCQLILTLYELHHSNEYLHFLLELYFEQSEFWDYYRRFGMKQRVIILEIIRDNQMRGSDLKLSDAAHDIFAARFISSAHAIFEAADRKPEDLQPYETSLYLTIIASFCGKEQYLKYYQKNKDLLITSGTLLITIHKLGKESDNYFSSVQSLSAIREPTDLIREHPAFGFKVELVRLIGNLCWKNKEMQDLVRTADLIPVLLDCCNIDARNPFIMQWVILAVRNLCEKNEENQKVIASLNEEGTVSSSVLEELGYTLHSDGENEIKLVPLDALRNKQ